MCNCRAERSKPGRHCKPLLPSVVSKLGLTCARKQPDQLMLVAIYSPKGTHNITFLDNYTNTFIEDAILRVPGVGDVTARTDKFRCGYG